MTAYTSITDFPFAAVPYAAGDSLATRARSAVAKFVVHLELVGNRFVADEDVELPGWIGPILRAVFRLESLPRNWDSYGAIPVQRRHTEAVLDFLGLVMTDDVELPEVVPLGDGGLQLEWRRDDLEVDFISDDELATPTLFVTRPSGVTEAGGLDAFLAFNDVRRALRAMDAPAR
jgi:hypothetical protein